MTIPVLLILREKPLSKKREAGEDPTCRREYFCKRTRDEDNAIITQFKPEIHVKDFKIPDKFHYMDRYMALDLGVVDKSSCIYGFYNHLEGILYLQDEVTLQGKQMTSDSLGRLIQDKKNEVWQTLPTYMQISDNNNLMTVNDMNLKYGLIFTPTRKTTLHAMVGNLNNLFQQNRVIIHPRCVELIGSVDAGVWDKRRAGFGRHPVWGHFDALAALMYLALNLNQSRSPIPKDTHDPSKYFITRLGDSVNEEFESLKRRFLWNSK
jgi:hypothetical protein